MKRLDWDSQFFGYEIALLHLKRQDLFDFNSIREKSKNYRLVYVFSDDEIKNSDLKLVDSKVILVQNTRDFDINDNDLKFELYSSDKHDFNTLKSLALSSGQFSRFKIDSNFVNNEYELLYNRWIEKSIELDSGIKTYVSIFNNEINGFVTLSKKTDLVAEIGLIAVSENSRGLGFGSKLLKFAISTSKEHGCEEIQVATQYHNEPAMKLYFTNNFKIKTITHIYHLWNE